MKRKIAAFVAFVLLALASAPLAEAARVRVRVRTPRARITVRAGFPIRRPLPHVVVRAPRTVVRVTPGVYLPAVVFTTAVVATPIVASALVWEDSETLEKDDDWTDFTLNVDNRGRALYLEVKQGRAQVNFAEVVFENGEAQVVDFDEAKLDPGLYQVLDFKDGRKVDHVRIVARAKSDEVKLVARMAK